MFSSYIWWNHVPSLNYWMLIGQALGYHFLAIDIAHFAPSLPIDWLTQFCKGHFTAKKPCAPSAKILSFSTKIHPKICKSFLSEKISYAFSNDWNYPLGFESQSLEHHHMGSWSLPLWKLQLDRPHCEHIWVAVKRVHTIVTMECFFYNKSMWKTNTDWIKANEFYVLPWTQNWKKSIYYIHLVGFVTFILVNWNIYTFAYFSSCV